MRTVLLYILSMVLVILILPACIVWGSGRAVPVPLPAGNVMIKLHLHETEEVLEIDLEEYVRGVVAAEMPASFHLAALEAQAVAARTYVIRRALDYGGKGCTAHLGADICSDPSHCQAWLATSELQTKWGMLAYSANWQKVCQAVANTAGQVLTYQGLVIDPLFHSTCGGQTEAAAQVWQQEIPYLVSVACPYCRHSPRLENEQSFSWAAVAAALEEGGSLPVMAQATEGSAKALVVTEETTTGRVKTLSLAGQALPATALRSALGLYSTRFTIQADNNQVTFSSRGYGHGVGLCQYGADGMAEAGYDYLAILKYYYRGTEVRPLS